MSTGQDGARVACTRPRSGGDINYSFDGFYIDKLSLDVGRQFIINHHYSGGCGVAAMIWGLYHDSSSRLLGAIAFQTPISENVRASIFGGEHKSRVTELHRMAIVDDAPQNTATWFISRALKALKEYKPKYWAVISFADATEGHDGTVYQAANAGYYGTSRRAKFYRDESGQLRHPRQCGENISLDEARERGWDIVQRESKYRYVFWLPDRGQSKDDLRELACNRDGGIELQEYPEQ